MIKDLTLHNRDQQVIQAINENNSELDAPARKKKFAAMAESPYRFFRGTSHLFWQDMYNDWRFALFGGVAGTQTWIQGDAHVYNFGAFANHDGEVIYGLDDFDDAVVSDYQYDLWRLAVSLVLDTRANGSFDDSVCRGALEALVEGYLKTATRYGKGDLEREIHYTADTAGKPLKKFLQKVGKKKGRKRMLNKWTRLQKSGKRVFDATNPKLKRLSPVARKRFVEAFEAYRAKREKGGEHDFYRLKDVVRRISAGTGSLGTMRFYALIEGQDGSQNDDIILDIKEQGGPSLLLAMSKAELQAYRRVYPNEGVRHEAAFRALAEHPDRYLGWLEFEDRVFSIRERSPFKDDFPTDKLDKKKRFLKMAATWGEVLATEHKRASRPLNPDQPFMFEESVKRLTKDRESEFVTLVGAIATHYAECVERDFQTFLDAFEPSTD
ncbi:Uncharacterized conserved protein, DUF2252 family [Marinobacter sp. es.048]|uniref:DUF2252 domain-containing protein n=1 Tax=Marinobacter sp. es.048 TaxID=1761795 RepID=UPI000B58C618|nr:DUF2252 family protein [Marinobacter sp. es.048]SNC65885.1 Uncharacterized conserved protein, DUF2252 family [Marinobacter sp. es.048]